MELTGASAIVTGGASGLGEAVAHLLADQGCHVVIADRQAELGKKVAAAVGGTFCLTDVTDSAQVQATVAAATAAGPLRALVNSAGIGRAARTIDRDGSPADLAVFERVVRINLLGTFNCVRLAASAMAATNPLTDGERGAIVNVASVAAFDGQIGQAAYSASKAGITGMTLPLARDLAVAGIRVNTIAPGLFDTPIYGSGEQADQFKAKLASSVVFPRRLGDAAEFASLALELLRNSYLNGEVVRLDGAARMPPK
jgi:NAD(P)-dependent dehydrogenase (short-subunit alcohol dehydrogenase family)